MPVELILAVAELCQYSLRDDDDVTHVKNAIHSMKVLCVRLYVHVSVTFPSQIKRPRPPPWAEFGFYPWGC